MQIYGRKAILDAFSQIGEIPTFIEAPATPAELRILCATDRRRAWIQFCIDTLAELKPDDKLAPLYDWSPSALVAEYDRLIAHGNTSGLGGWFAVALKDKPVPVEVPPPSPPEPLAPDAPFRFNDKRTWKGNR
jgi:hypothetical protein